MAKNLNKSNVSKKAYFNTVIVPNGLTWGQNIRNAKINIQIEKLQMFVDGCKEQRSPFTMYKKEAFEINNLKKKLIRPEVESGVIELENGELQIDFKMF